MVQNFKDQIKKNETIMMSRLSEKRIIEEALSSYINNFVALELGIEAKKQLLEGELQEAIEMESRVKHPKLKQYCSEKQRVIAMLKHCCVVKSQHNGKIDEEIYSEYSSQISSATSYLQHTPACGILARLKKLSAGVTLTRDNENRGKELVAKILNGEISPEDAIELYTLLEVISVTETNLPDEKQEALSMERNLIYASAGAMKGSLSSLKNLYSHRSFVAPDSTKRPLTEINENE